MLFLTKPRLKSGFLYLFSFPLLLASAVVIAEQALDEQTVNQPITREFELSFELESLGDLSELTGIDLPPSGPVSLKANINTNEQEYTLSDIRLIVGKSDISGDLSVSHIGEHPALIARLKSERIDLSEFYINEESTEDIEENDSDKNVTLEIEKIFSTDPLPLDFIRDFDMELYYSAKTILSHDIVYDNFELIAKQVNGNLDIHTLNADVANGKLNFSGSINAANAPPLVSVNMDVSKLEPGLLPKIKVLNAIEGLPTEIIFEASGTGNSLAEIMGTLNGKFLSKSAQGINYVTQINQLGISFLIKLLNTINPFRKKQNETQINCIVVKFDIQDGEAIADRGIAAQTKNLNVIGGGIIDLKSEQFDFILHPEARSGINIGTITLVDAVLVSGRFSDPVINAETKAALMKRAGTVGTVLLTGGLSYIAQKLFEKNTFKDDPCGEALRDIEPVQNSDKNDNISNGTVTR